jgi:hypothetical protein
MVRDDQEEEFVCPVASDATVMDEWNVNSVTVLAGTVSIRLPKSALTVAAPAKSVAQTEGVGAAKPANRNVFRLPSNLEAGVTHEGSRYFNP